MNFPTTRFVLLFLLLINVIAYVAFWRDKRQSGSRLRRTPERRLLALAFWGGSVGALLAQQLLHHKTRKQPFRLYLITIALLQLLLLLVLLIPMSRDFVLHQIAQFI